MSTSPVVLPVAARSSRAGTVVTIVLCGLLFVYSALLGVAGLFLGFYSDSCEEQGSCNGDELTVGVLVGAFGPFLLAVVAIILAIIHLVRRRPLAWLFPIGGWIAGTIAFFLALFVVESSVGLPFGS